MSKYDIWTSEDFQEGPQPLFKGLEQSILLAALEESEDARDPSFVDTVIEESRKAAKTGTGDALSFVYSVLGAIPKGLDGLNNWTRQKIGKPLSPQEQAQFLSTYMQERSQAVISEERPETLAGRVGGGVVSGALQLPLFGMMGKLFGAATGFGAAEGMAAYSHGEDAEGIAFATAKGVAFGKLLHEINKIYQPGVLKDAIKGGTPTLALTATKPHRNVANTAAVGAGMSAADPRSRNIESMVESGLVFGALGAIPHMGRGRGWTRPTAPPPETSPKTPATDPALKSTWDALKENREKEEAVKKGIRKAQAIIRKGGNEYIKTAEDLAQVKASIDLDKEVLRQTRVERKKLEEATGMAEFARQYEFVMADNAERAQRLADAHGTSPEYEMSRLDPNARGILSERVTIADPDNTRAGASILNSDTRDQLSKRILREEAAPGINKDGTPRTRKVKSQKDVPYPEQEGRTAKELAINVGQWLLPSKFSQYNDLLKYFGTRLSDFTANVPLLYDKILYAPEFTDSSTTFGLMQRKASAGGMLTIFSSLPESSKTKVRSAAHALDYEASEAILRGRDTPSMKDSDLVSRFDLNPTEIKSLRAIRDGHEQVADLIDGTIRVFGETHDKSLPPIKRIPGYIAHTWQGRYRLFVDPNVKDSGLEQHVLSFRTQARAKKMQKIITSELGADRVRVTFRDMGPSEVDANKYNVNAEHIQRAIKLAGDTSPAGEALKSLLSDVHRYIGKGIRRKTRKNVQGFQGTSGKGEVGKLLSKSDRALNKEFEDGLKGYVMGTVRYTEGMRLKHEYAQLQRNFGRFYPGSMKHSELMMQHTLGIPPTNIGFFRTVSGGTFNAIIDVANRVLTKVSDREITAPGTLRTLNRVTMYLKLHNMAFVMSMPLQTVTMVPARMLMNKSSLGKTKVMRAALKGIQGTFFPNAEQKEAIKYATLRGITVPSFIKEGHATTEYGGVVKAARTKMGKAIDIATLKSFVEGGEELSRASAYLMFYEHARAAGLSKASARAVAGHNTQRSMVEYTLQERALIFGERGLGMGGTPVGLFKTFQTNFWGQAFEYMAHTKNTKEFAPLLAWMTAQVLVAGVQGVIGFNEADLLLHGIDTVTQKFGVRTPTLSKFLMENPDLFPNWLRYGLASTWLGFDITSTSEAPSLTDAGSIISAPALEVAANLVGNLWETRLGYDMITGKAPLDQQMKFWMDLAPVQLRAQVEQYYTWRAAGIATGVKDLIPSLTNFPTEHPIPDHKRKMRGTVIRDRTRAMFHDANAWYVSYFGRRPLTERRALDDFYAMTGFRRDAEDVKSGIALQWADFVARDLPVPEHIMWMAQENGVTAEMVKNILHRTATTFFENEKYDDEYGRLLRKNRLHTDPY